VRWGKWGECDCGQQAEKCFVGKERSGTRDFVFFWGGVTGSGGAERGPRVHTWALTSFPTRIKSRIEGNLKKRGWGSVKAVDRGKLEKD